MCVLQSQYSITEHFNKPNNAARPYEHLSGTGFKESSADNDIPGVAVSREKK